MPASDDEPMAPVRTASGGESGAGAAAGALVGAGAAAAGAVVAAAGGALPAAGAAAFGAAAGAWPARRSRLSSAGAPQRRGARRDKLIRSTSAVGAGDSISGLARRGPQSPVPARHARYNG